MQFFNARLRWKVSSFRINECKSLHMNTETSILKVKLSYILTDFVCQHNSRVYFVESQFELILGNYWNT